MKVVFRISEDTAFQHVRVEAAKDRSKGGSLLRLEDFTGAIKERFPDFDKYYWRHRPSREEHRDFERDDVTVKFYARFSVPKNGAAKKAVQSHLSPNSMEGFGGEN